MSLYLSARHESGQRGGSMCARQPDRLAIVLSTSAGRLSVETLGCQSVPCGPGLGRRSWCLPVPWASAPARAALLDPQPTPASSQPGTQALKVCVPRDPSGKLS